MFNVGDIVTVTENSGYYRQTRKFVGEIILFDDLGDDVPGGYAGINFGEGFNGHDLGGKVMENTHYWIEVNCLKLYKKNNREVY